LTNHLKKCNKQVMKKILILLLCSIFSLSAADLKLAWNANPLEELVTEYTLVYGTKSGELGFSKVVSGGSTTTTTINGLADDTTYFFAIKAKNASGESPLSPEISAKTPPVIVTPPTPPAYDYLDRSKWAVSVSSEETVGENNKGILAIDGNKATIWHSLWDANVMPQFFSVNLSSLADVKGISYLPRQDGNLNGSIRNYDIATSNDGTNWVVVSSGEFAKNTLEKVVLFPVTKAKFVRLIAKTDWAKGNLGWASIAEFKVIGIYDPVLPAPNPPTGLRVE